MLQVEVVDPEKNGKKVYFNGLGLECVYEESGVHNMSVSSEAGRRLPSAPRRWYVRANCMNEREAELYEARVERAREAVR